MKTLTLPGESLSLGRALMARKVGKKICSDIGSTRAVWRIPGDFWCYKFDKKIGDRVTWAGSSYATIAVERRGNRNEYNNYLKMEERSNNDLKFWNYIRLPRVEYFVDESGESIIAMEFFENVCHHPNDLSNLQWDAINDFMEEFKLLDIYEENLAKDSKGMVVPIDLAV